MTGASGVFAYLQQVPGREVVANVFAGAAISSMNWSEVLQKSLACGLDVAGLLDVLSALGLPAVPFAAEDAEAAATLWPATRAPGLLLGDRACLALGLQRRCPVLTADRSWQPLSLGLDVRMIW